MRLHVFPCLQDNFGVLAHDAATGATAAIDAPEEAAVLKALGDTGWKLSHILVTHSHPDHVQGVAALKAAFGCQVIAPKKAKALVPADRYVFEGDHVSVGDSIAEVWETPGHCADHVIYHFDRAKVAFVGDVLFAPGCGRVFDGAYHQMWNSLSRLMHLPDETSVYFGHEYTLSNAKFALSVDPDNADLKDQAARAEVLRAAGEYTCPTTIGAERAANPFLRAVAPDMAARLGLAGHEPEEVFRELRERKNRF